MAYLTLLGLTAASLTTAAFIPQATRVWRSRSTKDISLSMFTMTCAGIALWFVYGYLLGDIPLMVANGITLVLAGSIVVAKLRFG